jgi:septum formation topological specificity factor MinE
MEEKDQATKDYIKMRKEQIVQLVLRQTDYTEEFITKWLEENKYDYLKLINQYMGIDDNVNKTLSSHNNSNTLNQRVYREIGDFLKNRKSINTQPQPTNLDK